MPESTVCPVRSQGPAVEGGVVQSPAPMAPGLPWLETSTPYPGFLAAMGQNGGWLS